MIVVVCCTGAFCISSSIMDVYVLLIFGVIAYLMQKVDLPPVPIVLGMVLGPIAESNLRNSLIMSDGSWFIFLQRPICLFFLALTFLLVYLLKRGSIKEKKAAQALQARMAEDRKQD